MCCEEALKTQEAGIALKTQKRVGSRSSEDPDVGYSYVAVARPRVYADVCIIVYTVKSLSGKSLSGNVDPSIPKGLLGGHFIQKLVA